MKTFSNKIRLKHLIVGIIGLAFLLSIVSSIYSSYRGNLKLLERQSLETNRVYAEKLAQTVDLLLNESIRRLEFSSKNIAEKMDERDLLTKEVERLQSETKAFNSVMIANEKGEILASAPKELNLTGEKIVTKEALQFIKNKKPIISDPYKTATGKLVISISQPIFGNNGEYKGVLNGTIYIHETNFLQSILGEHTYKDGSYVYVVDSKGVIIYHQQQERIGEDVSSNNVVKRIMNGESGSQRVINTLGVDMLAGFSTIKASNWGVVAQTPYEVATQSVTKEVSNMLLIELPLILTSMIIVIIIARKTVKPLQRIADIAENSIDANELKKLKSLNVWYYEALQIKNSLEHSLSFLHGQVSDLKDQSTIDPLTQIFNRRALDSILKSWIKQNKSFSIILLDIDHFKNVNDTFGHSVGDEVLKYLASQMKEGTREQDICCRYGGEEFIILLPDTSVQQAYDIAEWFRIKIGKNVSPTGKPITFSAGVASFPETQNVTTLIEAADEALYRAKRTGRNRVVIAKQLNN